MVLALQMVQNRVAEARGELPADTQLTVERLTPAVFLVFILALTGSLPTAELNDYALYVMRPALARRCCPAGFSLVPPPVECGFGRRGRADGLRGRTGFPQTGSARCSRVHRGRGAAADGGAATEKTGTDETT